MLAHDVEDLTLVDRFGGALRAGSEAGVGIGALVVAEVVLMEGVVDGAGVVVVAVVVVVMVVVVVGLWDPPLARPPRPPRPPRPSRPPLNI